MQCMCACSASLAAVCVRAPAGKMRERDGLGLDRIIMVEGGRPGTPHTPPDRCHGPGTVRWDYVPGRERTAGARPPAAASGPAATALLLPLARTGSRQPDRRACVASFRPRPSLSAPRRFAAVRSAAAGYDERTERARTPLERAASAGCLPTIINAL